MKNLGIIGAGNVGSELARLAIAAGYVVSIANSRGPETLEDLISNLGPQASAATVEAAAASADLVVVSIPVNGYAALPKDAFEGKIVIDTGNYYPEYFGTIPELEDGSITTAELLQSELLGSRVVKAFSHLGAADLAASAKPGESSGRIALLLAGDDKDAKSRVEGLMSDFGFDFVDAGSLAEGWRFQRDQPATGVMLGVAEITAALANAKK